MKTLTSQLFKLGRSSTAKDTYWVFAGDTLFTVATFFTTIIVAHSLSYVDVGVFIVLSTVIVLVVDVVDVGVGNALSHFIPTHLSENDVDKAWKTVKTAILFETGIGIVLAFIGIVSSTAISQVLFKTSGYADLVKITGVTTSLALLTILFGYTLTAFQRFPQRAVVNSLPGFVRLAMIGILAFIDKLTLSSIILILLVSFIPSILLGFYFLGRAWISTKISITELKTILRFSKFIGASKAVTALASRLDIIMLSSIIGPSAAGLYGVANRMTLVFPMLAGSFSSVVAPKFSQRKDHTEIRSFFKKVTGVSIGLISVAFFLMISADFLVPFIFGEKYRVAIGLFRLLLIPNIIFLATIPTVNLIIYTIKKPQFITFTSVVQLIIIVVCNSIFIPLYGPSGPIIGLTIAFSQVLVVTGIVSYNYLRQLSHDK